MSDIVDRLLRWGYSADPSTANDLMGEAADEITRLRAEKASDWGAACESARAASAEIARLRLTDAEREAVAWAINVTARTYDDPDGGPLKRESLRGLLERLGGCTPQSDCGADRKSVALQRCRDTGDQPFDSAPTTTLTCAEREAIERACRVIASTLPYGSQRGAEDYQTLRGLLERLGGVR